MSHITIKREKVERIIRYNQKEEPIEKRLEALDNYFKKGFMCVYQNYTSNGTYKMIFEKVIK